MLPPDRYLEVAVQLLEKDGWPALSLDRIAAEAGVSRATVWRHGITRAGVEQVLRQRLVADYHRLMWAPLTATGPASDRLAAAFGALCDVAERNLPLLAHTDTAFHGEDLAAAGLELDFFSPWLRIVADGVQDGSLPAVEDPARLVVALSNMVLLTYVHLRTHHVQFGWTPARTKAQLVDLVAHGYLP